MTKIDDYFLSKTNLLSYIELKNNRDIYIDYGLNDISLPVVTDELMKSLKNQELENEIDLKFIIKGILYNVAIDPEFKFIDDYKNILKNIFDYPAKYAVNLGVSQLDIDLQQALILFRSAYILDQKDKFAAYNYARLLWRLEVKEEDRTIFIGESVDILEAILRLDDRFSLSYYELGQIFSKTGNYIKAISYYKNALLYIEKPEIENEIRTHINEIEPEALIQDAIYYINKMNYTKAIELLHDCLRRVSRYDAYYYLAICYMNIENFEISEEYFEKALKSNADFSTLYIDYTYVKYILGKTDEALQIANTALERFPTDIKLRYNRAIIYISLGKTDKANDDFDFILEYADLSDELFNQIMTIKENMKNGGINASNRSN